MILKLSPRQEVTMKKRIGWLVLVSLLLLTGCAAKTEGPYRSAFGTETGSDSLPANEVKKIFGLIEVANARLDGGAYQDAMRLYDEILAEYSSDDGSLECVLLTNSSLAALYRADRELFLLQSGLAEAQCGEMKYLPQNSQFVLSVRKAFLGDSERAPHVGQGIHEAVFSTLY
jgi:hypothetical protein